MSDPERLSAASDSELERVLLRAGRARAPAEARERAVLAATAVVGAAGLAAGTAAAGGLAAKTGSLLSLKWMAVMGLVGIGAMTAAVVLSNGTGSGGTRHAAEGTAGIASDRAAVVTGHGVNPAPASATESASATATATAPATAPAPAPAPAPATAPATAPVSASPPPTSSVHAELATLDQARAALAAGDPARALSILDAYGASFPRASMGPEATVLRVEALARAGDMPAARRTGDAFLAAHPQSPYAARVRSLLGEANP